MRSTTPIEKPSARLQRLERDRALRLARQAREGWAARAGMISKAEIEALENQAVRGPLPKPVCVRAADAAPAQAASCAYTDEQLRAMEELVLEVARTTVAQPGTLFSGDCKVRVLVALKGAQVGFAEVNAARAGRVVPSPGPSL